MKNICIKLVKKDYYYIRMHGQQNIKIWFEKIALLESRKIKKKFRFEFYVRNNPDFMHCCVYYEN
jgi:glycine cleavage system protein P-like pyridoxal-binding family